MINIKTDLWQYLKNSNKTIVLYGMGDGALKILKVCESYNINISEIFASDEYVRGHSFAGYKVKTLHEIEESYDNFIILLAFAAFDFDLIKKIENLALKHELYAPDVPLFGDALFNLDFYKANEAKLQKLYDNLADEHSKKVLLGTINFKLSGDIKYLSPISTAREEDYKSLIDFKVGMSYVDLGAYDGDTVREFISHCPDYDKIFAFEPDPKNHKKLLANTENIRNITALNLGAYSNENMLNFSDKAGRNSAFEGDGRKEIPVNSVDNILKEDKADFIKFDVEGMESEALLGCKHTILKHLPTLGVAAYHRSEDLFALPELVESITDGYNIYLRHNYYIPAWENIFYFVAK